MGSYLHELSLDYKLKNKTISSFLREISVTGCNVSEKLQKIDEYVNKLEEEMRKIDAFKRELPLCMLLLNDAIVALRYQTTDITEEDEKVKSGKDFREKKNWMSSAQLWSSSSSTNISGGYSNPVQIIREVIDENPFSPFGTPGLFSAMKEEKVIQSVPVISITNPGIFNKVGHNEVSNAMFWNSKNNNSGRIFSASSGTNNVQSNLQRQQHPFQRKQRRCWSPELHRRFVSALQQLGGSQVATPKQIRELMHVDGLTNDEVKSHLQKYRLHVSRVPSVSTSTLGNPSVVIVGDSWVTQDQYENGDFKSSNLQSGSPQGPLNLEGTCAISLTTGGNSNSTDDEGDRKSENYHAEDRVLAEQ